MDPVGEEIWEKCIKWFILNWQRRLAGVAKNGSLAVNEMKGSVCANSSVKSMMVPKTMSSLHP
jgi:hypothetical protein